MTIGRMVGAGLVAAALAGCGSEGGELREATERRRAAGVVVEPAASADTAPTTEAPARLPAFVLEDAASAPTAADTPSAPAPTAADTSRAPDPAPDPGSAAWTAGTVDAQRPRRGSATLLDARTGVNAGFDRVVLEFAGGAVPGHRVEYVDRPVRECGSGRTVAVAGDGWLSVTLRGTRAHTEDGRATVQRRNRRVDMPVLRQMVFTCDFEGVVEIVLGVSSPNEFRVTELSDPARLIVDVRQ